jgi:hypothetical protein
VNYEEIQKLGASLRLINPRTLKPGRIWYYGGETYFDVFFELWEGDIHWFQITLRGRSLTWNARDRLIQTGITNEMVVPDVSYYPASKTIEDDRQPDQGFINVVKAILQSRSDQPLFQTMLHLLDESTPAANG